MSRRKICVVTGSRADYGLLLWLMKDITTDRACELLVWKPDYAGRDGLRRGLAETCARFRDPHNLAAYKTDIYNL